jgi:hypothetical protein
MYDTRSYNNTVCPDDNYGENCMENCTCDNDNTVSCDPVNGTCKCSEGWSGVRCQDDINECNTTTCPDNSQCVNTEGSFYCKCDVGYFTSSDGTCQGKVNINETSTQNDGQINTLQQNVLLSSL